MPAETWSPAFVAAGSNLDDPSRQVRGALDALEAIEASRLVAVSPLYASPPMGPPDQPDYVNAVAGLLTRLEPASLLAALQDLERRRGRRRSEVHWGPRRIDLDLLLHGDTVSGEETLRLPHPGMTERCFVLRPLADIAPALRLPDGRRIVELLNRRDCSQLRMLGSEE